MTCSAYFGTEYRCPVTIDDVMPAICALLPQGLAWKAVDDPNTDMHKYWRAVGQEWVIFHNRTCDLIEERFCDTAVETLDDWERNFLPDTICAGVLDLCEYINMEPTDCDGLAALASALDYIITGCCINGCCDDPCGDGCGSGYGHNSYGHQKYYGPSQYRDHMRFYLDCNSPALTAEDNFQYGSKSYGCGTYASPCISDLVCLLLPHIPGHMSADVEVGGKLIDIVPRTIPGPSTNWTAKGWSTDADGPQIGIVGTWFENNWAADSNTAVGDVLTLTQGDW